MITDKNRVYDGWVTMEGGVDAGRAPDTINVNQVQSAINMTFRGGIPVTRPGFRKLPETFPRKHYDPDPHNPGNVWKTDQLWCFKQKVSYPPFGAADVFIKGEYNPINPITRPPTETPPPDDIAPWFVDQNSSFIYKHGILQCAQAYSPHNSADCIMALIGGRLFKIVPMVNTAKVIEIKIEDPAFVSEDLHSPNRARNVRNPEKPPLSYMVQADKWLIAQDGILRGIIYDSAKARRSTIDADLDKAEIPVGTIMAYGMGRIAVTVNRRDVAFGDLFGSHSSPDPADSLILFTERNFLAEGFDAAIPFQQGIVTGMIFFPQLDTSTGNGQLMVFAERGGTSFFLSLPRDQWKTSQFQILSLLTTGLRGHRSIAVVNEDLWFRSDDGVRSYRQARSEPSGWAHIPLSTNVRQFLENDADWLLKFTSAIYFNNRIMVTCSPRWNNGRPSHYGMVVVDFDILSSFTGTPTTPAASTPAWDGQWISSGDVQPVQLLTGTFDGKTRAFMFALEWQEDENGDLVQANQLFEISTEDKDDFDDQPINWEIVSRSFDFGKLSQQSTPFTENELYDGDLWLREIIE